MKHNLILALIFISFTLLAYSGLYQHDLIGGTELNGSGCVCHNLTADPSVNVWIEGPDTLMAGQTGIYQMFLTGGPAEAGGYNVAGRFGTMVLVDTFSVGHPIAPNELTQAFPLVFPSVDDTIYWAFGYTASDSSITDTIYSCGLSIVYDGTPDDLDKWNFGPKFPIVIVDGQIPVELISFTFSVDGEKVYLNWITAAEINNYGFEIQRSADSKNWSKIGFVTGNSTSTELNTYQFVDDNNSNPETFYRLKQIDHNGSYSFSGIIEVNQNIIPADFILYQNYPNPFNPSTNLRFELNKSSRVSLNIFNVNGELIRNLLSENLDAGYYELNFDASELSSGVYYYSLQVGNERSVMKMVFLK